MKNRYSVAISLLIVVIAIILGITFLSTQKEKKEKEQVSTTQEVKEESNKTGYIPEDFVEDFCYIQNPEKIPNDVPLYVINGMGDYINQYLLEQDISNVPLQIETYEAENYNYRISMKIGNTDSILIYNYNLWTKQQFCEMH